MVIENPNDWQVTQVAYKELKGKQLVRKFDRDGFVSYYNVPCAFDIETTSFEQDDTPRALAYEFTFGIGDTIFIVRTWEAFLNILQTISKRMYLSPERRVVCFVHNLSFEFGFMAKRLKWYKIFATDPHRPLKAVSEIGFEFRCSARVSAQSLDNLAKNLTIYKCEKLIGDLDYSLKRTPLTPLTDQEKQYCINDVQILLNWIKEKIEQDGDITKIPLTNTGYVREYIRKHCLYRGTTREQRGKNSPQRRYAAMMKCLTLEREEYVLLKKVFAGGFVHSHCLNTRKIIRDVVSKDFTSSYPAVMVCEKRFPMSKGWKVDITGDGENFRKHCKLYACMFLLRLKNVESKFSEEYIAKNKCLRCVDGKFDNGKLISAKEVVVPVTEIDFEIIEKVYDFDSDFEVANFWAYRRGYLPKIFIECVLDFYSDKTTLKDVPESVVDYMRKKNMLNACFGMAVTDIVHNVIEYEAENESMWSIESADIEECLEKYNNDKKRFLFYPWGVWITALARRNLWTCIIELGNDRIYSDTDSNKYIHPERHEEYFRRYNEDITRKMRKVCEHYGIDFSKTCPKTVKGVEKPLGVWDEDGVYSMFKTLGSKRYMYETIKKGHKEVHLTLSGVSNKKGMPYLLETSGVKYEPVLDSRGQVKEYIIPLEEDTTPIFNLFDDELVFPAGYTGKLCHKYIDFPIEGTITDYLGQEYHYHEESGVWLGETEYSLGIDEAFRVLINKRQLYLV